MDTKVCTKCGKVKALDEYARDKSKRDGRRSQCKTCGREKTREWYAKNAERQRERNAAWRRANPAYMVEYRQVNAERIAEHRAAYYREHADRIREYSRARRQANRDKMRQRDREYREANAERMREYHRVYKSTHPHVTWASHYRQRCEKFGVTPAIEPFTRAELVDRYGDACIECGDPDWELDHQIPVAAGGSHSLENCRPLCFKHNRAKANDDKQLVAEYRSTLKGQLQLIAVE